MPKNAKDKKDSLPTKMADKIEHVIMDARRIFISDAIDNNSARDIIRKLWYMDLTEPGKPILLVINSPGGAVDSGFAIWDAVNMINSPVTTLVTGLAASMGSILCLCAAKGRRFATPNSRFMIHQPLLSGVIKGQATDLEIQAKEMVKTRKTLIGIYVEKTGKDSSTIEKAIDRDTWMTAEEALEFNHIDGIVTSFKEIE